VVMEYSITTVFGRGPRALSGHPPYVQPLTRRARRADEALGHSRAGSAVGERSWRSEDVTFTLRAALLAAVGTLAVAPAAQAACTPQPAAEHPFAGYGDDGLYTLVAGGDFEGDMAGWTLTGGAQAADGVLSLGPGDSATTAPICIDDTYPWFRFFASNTSDGKGKLKIDLLYTDLRGKPRSRSLDDYATADAGWKPSDQVGIDVDWDHAGSAVAVQFRFSAHDSFLLDDVYVDPMARG
jgi:hypothetical protein